MRNLLGRLHGRDDVELARIGAFWRFPLSGSNRHQAIGALYRAMTDIRTVRGTWERLTPEQQEMVRLLAVAPETDEAPTLVTLSGWLGLPLDDTRRIAIELYRVGVLAREGDDQPLPVGEEPRLFLPRELTLLFRRLLDDIDAGNLSRVPLEALLARLDDAEIEAAAASWGLPAQPGLRDRGELSRRLQRRIGAAGARDRVVVRLPADARRIWEIALAAPAPLPVRDVAAQLGLADDLARTEQRWRAALDALESSLLVWHTYADNGGRLLFIPAEIRTPRATEAPDLPPLQLALPGDEPAPWRHPHAFAWDLLTLLRDLAEPGAPPWPVDEVPRPRLRRLNPRLWWRGREVPPLGYVECLLALARAEGLILPGDGEAPAWRLTAAMRAWREQPFAAQTDRLRWWWQSSPEWIEGQAREALAVWGVEWPAARGELLAALTDDTVGLAPDQWYALDSVAARIAARFPGLLGPNFTAASARNEPDEEDAARRAAIAAVIEVELTTMFAWLGLVELWLAAAGALALRRPASDAGDGAVDAAPSLTISEDGLITVAAPRPLQVWSLSAFTELEQLAERSQYRLTAAAIGRALAAGFELAQITGFLQRQSGAPLPPALAERLTEWATGYRRVRVGPALWLTVDDPTALPALRELVAAAGWQVATELDGALVLRPLKPTAPAAPARARLVAQLRAHGFAPLVTGE